MTIQKMNANLGIFEIIKQDFPSKTKRKKLSLFTCFVLDPDINSKELDQKFPFGRLIGYGNSCMDNIWKIKIFRPHSILHDSAGSVKSTTKKGPGYCYVAPSLPSSCFLGHVTGLFFCLYVKIFASYVYALFGC